MRRAILRKEHETLIGDNEKIASILFMFLSLYTNYNTDNAYFRALGYDSLTKIPFHDESAENGFSLPKELLTLILNTLKDL